MVKLYWLLSGWLAVAGTPSKPTSLQRVEVSSQKLSIVGKENRAVYLGNVVARREGTKIRCDELRVFYTKSQNVQRLEAQGHVRVDDGIRSATSDFAEFDNLTGVVVMTGNPQAFQGGAQVSGSKVTFAVERDVAEVWDARTLLEEGLTSGKKAKVFIQSPKLQIFGKKKKAIWTGRVQARRGDTVIEADKATAFYADNEQLHSVEASQNVIITQRDNWAKGEHATYDHATGLAVLTGSPHAQQQGNRLRGSRVVFNAIANTVEVENAQTLFETHRGAPTLLEEKK